MNLKNLIPKKRYSASSYLQMLKGLFPAGIAWKFDISPVSPYWVEKNTYQYDDFTREYIDDNWNITFRVAHEVQVWNDQCVAVLIDSEYYTGSKLTDDMTGDCSLSWKLVLNANQGSNYLIVKTENDVVLFRVGWEEQELRVYTGDDKSIVLVASVPAAFVQYKIIALKIVRSGSTFSVSYNYDGVEHAFDFSMSDNSKFHLETYEYLNGAGISEFQFQADDGLASKHYTPASLLGKLMACFAAEFDRFDDFVLSIFRECIPGLSYRFLSDWETLVGLPDESYPTSPALSLRRQLVHSRYTASKGALSTNEFIALNKAYYISIAQSFNMTITISGSTAGRPFRWTTRSPGELQRVTRTPAEGIDGARFNSLGSMHTWVVTVDSDPENHRAILENIFDKLRPAHTVVIFKP